MRTLEFGVNGQKLSKENDFSGVVCGTEGYLKCGFRFFGNDWAKCKIIIVFKAGPEEHAVALVNDRTCVIPREVTNRTSFKVWAIGVRDDYKITTNKILVKQEV